MKTYETIAESTLGMLVAAEEVRAALFSGDESRLRLAIAAFWQALNADQWTLDGDAADAALETIAGTARASGIESSIMSNRLYCLELRNILGIQIDESDPRKYQQSASYFVAKLFSGNTHTWKAADPEHRKLITELPECEAALLEPAPDETAEAIKRLRTDEGQPWLKQAARDRKTEWRRMLNEAAMVQIESSRAPEKTTVENALDNAWLSPADIAKLYPDVRPFTVTKRLERWRKSNLGGDYREVEKRSSRDAQFVFRVGSIRHLFEPSSESSSEKNI